MHCLRVMDSVMFENHFNDSFVCASLCVCVSIGYLFT